MEAVQQAKETRATDLGWLLDASDDAVVTLIAGETRLLAHRAVLTDRSPVFAAMFQHRMLEASSGSVSIPDVEGPVLRELLAYLYCLQAPQLPSTALQLLAAADKYGVSGLKQACEQQLAAQLSVESAAATAVLAIRHSCDGLREAAVAYIKSHLVDVMATRGWAEAVCMQPKDVVEMGLLLSEISTPAPVDSGTPATAAPQPLSDHSGCRQTPASAAPPSAAAHHGSPHDEDADSRVSTPAPVNSGTSATAAPQPLSDHSGRCQTPASAAPPTSTTYHGSPHDEDADSCVSTPAAVDSGTAATAAPQPHSDHSGRRQTPASAAPPTAAAHHGSLLDEDADSRVSTPAAVDSVTSCTLATQPLSDHSGCRQTPASDAPPTEAALHGSPRDEAAVSTPAAVDSGTSPTPTRQPLSDCRQTPASAALLTAATDHSSPHDEAPSSRMRRLSPQEKGRRLIEAAWQGAVEELEALMEAGADVAAMDDLDRGTALHWAAYGGHEEAARRLLAAEAAVDARGRGRETPLHWAAMYGHAAVVRLLLAAGADHGARDAYGNTPLHLAAANGWVEAAAALLDGGADRAAKDDEGSTPLDEARRNNQQQVAKLLLADGGHTDAVLLE